MALKRTHEIMPLCHTIQITGAKHKLREYHHRPPKYVIMKPPERPTKGVQGMRKVLARLPQDTALKEEALRFVPTYSTLIRETRERLG